MPVSVNTFDVAQFLSNAAKAAGELIGDIEGMGTAFKVTGYTLARGKGDRSIKLLKAFQKINNQTWKGSGRSSEAAHRLRSPAPSCP